ncbi:NAD-dependent epimerase/dehydratase family protein [Streptomyces sp. NPDC050658]|uniref:NAD-dependent epimerase/dehydratase family protein n=1 Tax=unclassified Streptomyces TaxID=2593676 RepID=UPI00343CB9E4
MAGIQVATERSVLVLGATGYLGRHICAAFAATGARVVRVSRGSRDDGTDIRLDVEAADTAELTRLCAESGARVVVNAVGAVWSGTEQQMTALNDRFVERLTDAVAALPGRPRLIQLGSTHEYGPAGPDDVIDEDWPQEPTTVYGRTKLAGTRTVLRAVRERKVDGVVLRVSVSWGPGAPVGSLPGMVAARLAAGHDELRLAPLVAHRDVVDVRDVADAIVAAAGIPESALAATGPVINIARGETVPVRELVDLMISTSGRSVRVQEERSGQPNRSDALWQRLDVTRARRLLGWAPHRSLTDSVRDLLTAAGAPGPAVPQVSTPGRPTAEGRTADE